MEAGNFLCTVINFHLLTSNFLTQYFIPSFLRIKLNSQIGPIKRNCKSFKKDGLAAKKQLEEYEDNLIKASKIIKKNLRLEDSYTRMAVNGFYILIAGDKSEIILIIERFKKLFADRSLYQVGSYRLIGDPSPTDWLSEIDDQYFAPHNPK